MDTDGLPKAAVAAGCRHGDGWPEPDGEAQIKTCPIEQPNAGDRRKKDNFLSTFQLQCLSNHNHKAVSHSHYTACAH